MKIVFLIASIIATLAVITTPTEAKMGLCIPCTFVVHLSEQIAIKRKTSIRNAFSFWCSALGGQTKWISDVCDLAFFGIADKIQVDYDAGRTADYTCYNTLQMCDPNGPRCNLVDPREADIIALKTIQSPAPDSMAQQLFFEHFEPSEEASSILDFVFSALTGWSSEGGVKSLKDYSAISRHAPQKLGGIVGPIFGDEDKDGSSTFQQARGFDWRGKDCNDNDPTIYPSRKDAGNHPPGVDHDCNGIFGVDPTTKKSYEDLYCKDTKRFEFVQIGDSATAGFTIPKCWLSADCITKGTYNDLLPVIMNEADFPSCSAVAGWNATSCPSLDRSITDFVSVYNYARNQNPCIHRAYHNIGINGASSITMGMRGDQGQIYSFKRDQKKDHPVAAFFALIGNDVCSSRHDDESFTDLKTFEQGWMNSLEYLDTQLPPGSWVFAGGLVDGRLLYDIMHNHIHPLGGIKYSNLYNFLNCHTTSPCSGWLNADPAVRDRTTAHARKLNEKLQEIVAKAKFKNFKLRYNDYEKQVAEILTWAKKNGHDPRKFIADIDSFHPSSTLYSKLASSFINHIAFSDAAEIFQANPNREAIFSTFGFDLNGY